MSNDDDNSQSGGGSTTTAERKASAAKSADRPTGSKPAAKKASSRTSSGSSKSSSSSSSSREPGSPDAPSKDLRDSPISPGAATTHGGVDDQRQEQLRRGHASGDAKKAANAMKDATPAEHRAGHLGAKPVDGRVDNMTRRSDADAIQGHFVLIDFANKEFGDTARKAVEAVIGNGNARVGSGDYGVFTDVGTTDPDTGYPLLVNVLLRDEHSAIVGGVPYGALIPAEAGRR